MNEALISYSGFRKNPTTGLVDAGREVGAPAITGTPPAGLMGGGA